VSVPFEIIACEACGYRATSLVTAGKFVWTEGGEEYAFGRDLAVCRACCQVVAMECLPDRAELAATPPAPVPVTPARTFLDRLLRRPTPQPEPDRPRQSFRVAERVLALARKPVCLSCGSPDVIPIPRSRGGSRDETVRPLGLDHPGCGGALTIQGSGLTRIAPRAVARLFDIHGRQVGERPGWR
jgi:hypothetical protein